MDGRVDYDNGLSVGGKDVAMDGWVNTVIGCRRDYQSEANM